MNEAGIRGSAHRLRRAATALRRGWLPRPLFKLVQRLVPILCVDILPVRERGDGGRDVGLITRDSTDGPRQVFALVGGRVLRGETLNEAIRRHMEATLGPHLHWDRPPVDRPHLVADYAPHPREDQHLDPRQRAVALTWRVVIHGDPAPGGEARAFAWFPADALPAPEAVMPGHLETIRSLITPTAGGGPAPTTRLGDSSR